MDGLPVIVVSHVYVDVVVQEEFRHLNVTIRCRDVNLEGKREKAAINPSINKHHKMGTEYCINPSYAEVTFVQSTTMQRILKNIKTLSCWYYTELTMYTVNATGLLLFVCVNLEESKNEIRTRDEIINLFQKHPFPDLSLCISIRIFTKNWKTYWKSINLFRNIHFLIYDFVNRHKFDRKQQ